MSRYPEHLSPVSPTRPKPKPRLSRGRREPSGAFTMFEPKQIQQFKEAFLLIDQDRDGLVSEDDLRRIFGNLGITPTKAKLDELLNSRPGGSEASKEGLGHERGINFTMFLTMMGEHLFEFDTEAELIEAFECFDETDSGTVKCEEVRRWLSDVGERMDQEEIDRLLKGPFTDRQGNFNYREWVKVLRVNAEEEGVDLK